MTIGTGNSLPDLTLKYLTADGPANVELSSLTSGKKIVMFGVPGAFTPTCTLNHLPGFIENAEAIKAKGIDEIVVVAVNDPFVVGAWAAHSGGKEAIRFIADWDGALTEAIGMDIDLGVAGLGKRSKRYSMIVEDGTVTALNVEDNPGEAEISGAAALLKQL
jgi:peroxiredoxin